MVLGARFRRDAEINRRDAGSTHKLITLLFPLPAFIRVNPCSSVVKLHLKSK
jgi:hypothetical protein